MMQLRTLAGTSQPVPKPERVGCSRLARSIKYTHNTAMIEGSTILQRVRAIAQRIPRLDTSRPDRGQLSLVMELDELDFPTLVGETRNENFEGMANIDS